MSDEDAVEDALFMEELRRAHAAPEPTTDEIRATARALSSNRRHGALLAELEEDSADCPAGGLRETSALTDTRYAWFHDSTVTVRLEIVAFDGQRDVVGRVTPAPDSPVLLQRADSTSSHPVDPDGAFTARGLARGPLSLLVLPPGGPMVATRWITV
ncbi:hypothetical protein FHX37_2219 [Haloactinospora alba]|uniref:Uncharacterized protein n=1 Tax=Haloactinospora alba TaxID=405555 RepID=A0A543NKF7_9ACTN|nr:hypothetical protein [Haloactinospora alba]TQN32269.1 hypothetical protein FHX37_2219 [Haloactinospora alba]